jgi:imidazole glycerol-phosphate synthase subunit HisH
MIALVDYGISNLRSVQKAFERLDTAVTLVDTPARVAQADRLILPGVGAFPAGMRGLRERGLIEPIKQAAGDGRPLIGICLGLQLLFEASDEMGETRGLGLLPGRVTKMRDARDTGPEAFHPPPAALKVPHVGWNQLEVVGQHPLLRDLVSGSYAYFVHSYAVYPGQRDIVLATTDYGGPFVSIAGQGNVCGLQFHPEKSQAVGLKLLSNFLEM